MIFGVKADNISILIPIQQAGLSTNKAHTFGGEGTPAIFWSDSFILSRGLNYVLIGELEIKPKSFFLNSRLLQHPETK